MSPESSVPDTLRERYSLKLFAVSMLIVLIIVGFSVVTALEVSQRVTDEQLNSMEANAELEAKAVGQWLDGEQQAVRLLSSRKGLDPEESNRTRETLLAELDEMPPETAHLHLVERTPGRFSAGINETILASTNRSAEGKPLSATDIDWNPEVGYNFEGSSDVLISWVYTDGRQPSVALASPTPDGDHVLVAEYRTNVRAERFTSVSPETETLVLGGFTAYVLFDDDLSNVITEYEGNSENTTLGRRILDTDPTAELNGSVLTATEVKGYHSVPGEEVDWVVVKEAPRSSALALTDQVQADLTLLILITLVGFLLVGVVIQFGPIRAIQRLTSQATAISRGDLDIEISDEGRVDEIGRVRRAFRDTKTYVETITRQSEALSRQEFDAAVLDEEIPGRVGEAMATMRADLEGFISELEAERNRYSTLVEQSSDGVAVVQDGQFVFVNDRFVEITGYERDALLDLAVDTLLTPEIYTIKGDGEAPTETPEEYQIGMTTRTGEHRTLAIAVSRIEHDGAPAVMMNVRDVTERERRERRLAVFNHVLRHNLRNELDVIRSHAEVLDDDHANQIVASTKTLAEIGNRARTVDQLMSREPAERRFDLADLLTATLDSVAGDASGATVDLDIPDSAPLTTDREAVELALESPLANAVEYAASRVTVRVESGAGEYTVVIADDGDGIPEQELRALYSDSEPDLGHGRSLGLWELKCAVDKLGGDLSFETDDGTTVRLTIPDRSEEAV